MHANGELHKDDPKYKNFLQNIKGVHYHSTLHLGSPLVVLALTLPYWKNKSKIVLGLKTIDDEFKHLNQRFHSLADGLEYRDKKVSAAIGEKNETRFGVRFQDCEGIAFGCNFVV